MEKSHPKSVSAAAPRTIKVVEFAKSRAAEIKMFTDAMKTYSGSKRAFQTLPKHLRRRAMSHNIHRIPRRLRAQAKKEIEHQNKKEAKPKKLFRRHKRRPSYILRDYIRRQMKYKWLETHIWHAKRMKMKAVWGHKIAEHLRDKGLKAIYRAASHVCTLHDASYYTPLEFEGPQGSIISLMKLFIDPLSSSIGNRMYLHGSREGKLMLHQPEKFPFGAIAPASFLWNPQENVEDASQRRKLWMWIHPAASETALKLFQDTITEKFSDVTVTSLKEELLRFEFVGPRTHIVLNGALTVAENEPKDDSKMDIEDKEPSLTEATAGSKVWKEALKMRTAASLPSGCVIAFSVEDPRVYLAKKKALLNLPPLKDDYIIENHNWSVHSAKSELWDKSSRQAIIHAKSNKDKVKVPVIMIQKSGGLSRGFGSGWDVILPAHWAMPFWINFVHAGARAIGLAERYKICSEQGIPSFPEDYPDTPAYLSFAAERRAALLDDYNRHPPSKRINYSKIKIDHPFDSPWQQLLHIDESAMQIDDDSITCCVLRGIHIEPLRCNITKSNYVPPNSKWVVKSQVQETVPTFELESVQKSFGRALVRVSIRSLQKGTPFTFTMICAPEAGDYVAWKKNPDSWGVEETPSKSNKNSSTCRRVIGYVSSGGYSLVRGCGYGIGFCSAAAVVALFESAQRNNCAQPGFVLFRETNSTTYRPALLALTT